MYLRESFVDYMQISLAANQRSSLPNQSLCRIGSAHDSIHDHCRTITTSIALSTSLNSVCPYVSDILLLPNNSCRLSATANPPNSSRPNPRIERSLPRPTHQPTLHHGWPRSPQLQWAPQAPGGSRAPDLSIHCHCSGCWHVVLRESTWTELSRCG